MPHYYRLRESINNVAAVRDGECDEGLRHFVTNEGAAIVGTTWTPCPVQPTVRIHAQHAEGSDFYCFPRFNSNGEALWDSGREPGEDAPLTRPRAQVFRANRTMTSVLGTLPCDDGNHRYHLYQDACVSYVTGDRCPNEPDNERRFHARFCDRNGEILNTELYCFPAGDHWDEVEIVTPTPSSEPVPPPRPANGEPVITFGFEVETTARYGRAEVVRRLEAAGLRANEAYYSGSNYNVWQVKTDGSLHGRNAMEIVSPVLTFGTEDTERQVKALHDVLRDVGARANESCGLHVHMSVDHLNSTQLMDLIDFYHNRPRFWERVAGRGATQWCRRFNSGELDSLRTYAARGDWHYFSGATDRYRTINTAHYSNRGTLEFRQHDGATTYHEIMAWVTLLHGMVIAAGEDRLHELRCPNGTPVEDMVARFVEADLLQEDMRQWLLGNIPSERFSEVIAAAAPEVAEQVAESVARMLRLQGIDV